MPESINDIVARTPTGGTALLPSGEYEGPLYITRPIKLVGNNTTLWAKRGSVIEVTCAGAALENISAELTESDGCVIRALSGALTQNVEVLGSVQGFGAEDGYFIYPRALQLGSFAAENKNTYLLKIYVPVAAEIECSAAGVRFSPTSLSAGENTVKLTVEGISPSVTLYTEAIIRSQFMRRMIISGHSSAEAQTAENTLLFDAARPTEQASDVISVPEQAPSAAPPTADIRKGQRIALGEYVGTRFSVQLRHGSGSAAECDPYAFLLDTQGKTFGSRGLVFFGNDSSDDGSVTYRADNGSITIDLDKTDYRVDKILLVYSLYEESAIKRFSDVKSPCAVITADGKERIIYSMYSLGNTPTVIALEFYNYKGEWKVSAVGRSCPDGLGSLCESVGIAVTD